MLALGQYRFGVWNAAYQQLQRQDAWRWSEQKRIGTADALHYTGRTPTSISLTGVIFPTFRGGLDQLDDMRAEANRATPLRLVAGNGTDMGRWVIVSITERQAVFLPAGVPKKVTFTINLKKYD